MMENPLHNAVNVDRTLEAIMELKIKGKDRLAILKDLMAFTSTVNLLSARWLALYNSSVIAAMTDEDFKDFFYCQRNAALQFLRWDLIMRQRALGKSVEKLGKSGVV